MQNNYNKIVGMYFDMKERPVDIAKKLNISRSAVTQQLKKDVRYSQEKQVRITKNRERHIQETKEYIKKKREEKKADDLILKQLHKTDSIELSARKKLSDIEYRNWNKSAYKYNSEKNRFEFREELGRSYDVPKYIKNIGDKK